MKLTEINPLWIAAGAAVVAVAWVMVKGPREAGREASSAIVEGAADLANGVLQGTVEGAGKVIGIPVTEQSQCDKDKAAGRTWDASFSCPALEFGRYLKERLFGK